MRRFFSDTTGHDDNVDELYEDANEGLHDDGEHVSDHDAASATCVPS